MLQKATGIIAEYNPLHRGHRYHIEKASESGDPIVVVLSSDFTQRGEPAFIDKTSRTMMALKAGADLVLELPVIFSCHNGGVFANAAVDILEATGVVDRLSFGMETVPPNLEAIVAILVEEPKPFKHALRSFLDLGYSFVRARAEAAEETVPGALEFLSNPNNSLAVSYMSRIAQRGYAIKPLPVKRIGGGYHEDNLSSPYPSATAIRNSVRSGNPCAMTGLPEESRVILESDMARGRCLLGFEELWKYLRFLLTRTDADGLKSHAEFSEGIENRFICHAKTSASWEDFIGKCSSKRYPRSRLQRNMAHLLIGLDHLKNRLYQEKGPAYIKPLGATERGRELLRLIGREGRLPVVTRAGRIKSDPYGLSIMEREHRACDIWELLVPGGKPGRDVKTPPIMI